jgi:hypothetical membrane protein
MARHVDRATLPTEPAPAALATPRPARWLALGAVAGPILFTLTWVVLGFVSPGYTLFGTRIAPYSPVSQPISGLGLGDTGPFMNAAFILGGLLLLAGVIGVFQTIGNTPRPAARRASVALLALTPLGMVTVGVFTLEAVLAHLIGFLLAVGTPVLSFLVAGRFLRDIPGWRRFGTWLLLGSPLTLVLLVLFFLTFVPTAAGAQEGVGGLTQRLLVVEVLTWFVAMGWLASRAPTSADGPGRAMRKWWSGPGASGSNHRVSGPVSTSAGRSHASPRSGAPTPRFRAASAPRPPEVRPR